MTVSSVAPLLAAKKDRVQLNDLIWHFAPLADFAAMDAFGGKSSSVDWGGESAIGETRTRSQETSMFAASLTHCDPTAHAAMRQRTVPAAVAELSATERISSGIGSATPSASTTSAPSASPSPRSP